MMSKSSIEVIMLFLFFIFQYLPLSDSAKLLLFFVLSNISVFCLPKSDLQLGIAVPKQSHSIAYY